MLKIKASDFDTEKLKEYVSKIPKEMKFLTEFDDLSNKLFAQKDVIIRVYILKLTELANRDDFVEGTDGKSDPFIKIYLENDYPDNEVQGKDSDYIEDVSDTWWAKSYE